ncbi:MAG: hypothetical protein ACPGQL_04410 [Thermoplasmatota archaeon]
MTSSHPRRATLTVALLCLLLGAATMPVAAAQADLEAVRAEVGPGQMEGGLVALAIAAQARETDHAGAEASQLFVSARQVDVKVDEAQDGPAAGGVGVGGQPASRQYRLHNATGAALPVQASNDLAILRLPGQEAPTITWTSEGGSAEASEGTYRMEDRIGTGRSTMASLDGALTWGEQAVMPVLRIEGDFLVGLWEWDLRLDGEEGTRTETTGRDSDAPQALPVLVQSESSRSQAYLSVRDGVLELTGMPMRLLELHVEDAEASTSAASFHDVTGRLPGGEAVEATRLSLEGALDIRLTTATANGLLSAAVGGAIDEAAADGVPLSVVVGDPGGWSRYWPWLLVLGAAVATPAGVVGAQAAQHKRQSHRMEDLEFLVQGGHLMEALAVADDLVLSKAYADDALLLKADALLQLGRPDEALGILGRHWHPATQAPAACLRGIALSRLERGPEAVEQLRTAFATAPHLAARARADPAARSLLRDPRLQHAAGAWT